MKHFAKFGIIVAVTSAMAAAPAFAGPIEMILSSGSNNTTLLTGTDTTPSTVGYGISTTVNGWTFHPQTGATSYSPQITPLVGMDLSAYTVTCLGGTAGCSTDPLSIAVSATGFTTPISANGFNLEFSGNANGGAATTQAYFDTKNNYFCNDSNSSTLGNMCGSSNSIGKLTLANTNGASGLSMIGGPMMNGVSPYSLTIVDTFATNKNGVSYSVDTSLLQTPEPGALALFGAGLLGCALFINRRRRDSHQI